MFSSSSSSSKVTYVSALTDVLATCELTDEVREKLEALKTSLEKRSAHRSTKETKSQREARMFREAVYGAIKDDERWPKYLVEMGVSVQKASAALRALIAEGKVEKTIEKGKPLFKAIA